MKPSSLIPKDITNKYGFDVNYPVVSEMNSAMSTTNLQNPLLEVSILGKNYLERFRSQPITHNYSTTAVTLFLVTPWCDNDRLIVNTHSQPSALKGYMLCLAAPSFLITDIAFSGIQKNQKHQSLNRVKFI